MQGLLREDAVIDWIRSQAAKRGLVADLHGLTADAGVVCLPGGPASFSIDSHVEGVHFPVAEADLSWVGRRAVVAAVSDAIVTGPSPYFIMWDLQIPIQMEQDALHGLVEGLLDGVEECGAKLVAGNLRFGNEISIQVSVTGTATAGQRNAKSGDVVVLCDTVGDAWLDRVRRGRGLDSRYCYPPIYQEVAEVLRPESVLVSDLTDGLLFDLGRLALRLGYQVELELRLLPRSQSWLDFTHNEPMPDSMTDLQDCFFGSDEYFPIAVLPAQVLQSTIVSLEKSGHSLYAVGSLKPGSGLKINGAGLAPEFVAPAKLISQKMATAKPCVDAMQAIDWNW